jgi:FkbM family methyltransferase
MSYSIKMIFSRIITKIFSHLGLTIARKSNSQEINQEPLFWLRKYPILQIIDIGANIGQFANKISRVFPEATLICFEPIPNVFKELKKGVKGNNQLFFNTALGSNKGKLKINRNEYSPSSSILKMEKLHMEAFEFAVNQKLIDIEIDLLDNYLYLINENQNLLVKIDVQGFEKHVINGGKILLSKAQLIIIEVSYEPLYQGQPTFKEIYDELYNLGFEFHGNIEDLRNPKDDSILQSDALFINRSK